MNYKKYVSGAVVTAAFAALTVLIPLSANAATASVTGSIGAGQGGSGGHMGWGGRGGMGMMGSSTAMRPAVVGQVTAINGTSLTVQQGARPAFGSNAATATTTFTVDASSATVMKDNATSTVSSIAVNDMVAVQGTVSGTNVVATTIRDGFEMRMGGGHEGENGMRYGNNASSSNNMPPSPITGNGQPIVAGTISAINGSSLTITNKSNVTYTVDATNAKIVEGQNTITVSSLSVGDSVIVQGSVNGNSVSATSVIDQKAPAAGSGMASSTNGHPGGSHGILGSIGGFFMHIFGF